MTWHRRRVNGTTSDRGVVHILRVWRSSHCIVYILREDKDRLLFTCLRQSMKDSMRASEDGRLVRILRVEGSRS